jgi:hypothetical protein
MKVFFGITMKETGSILDAVLSKRNPELDMQCRNGSVELAKSETMRLLRIKEGNIF